jgi:sec-independent protein translocase protein TatA
MSTLHTLAFQIPGMGEWVVIAIIGLLFFGKRLPEVGRSLGKGIVEFKKGLKGIEDDVDAAVDEQTNRAALPPKTTVASATLPPVDAKFDPYTGKPIEQRFDPYTGKPLNGESAEVTTVTAGEPQTNAAH